MIYIITYDLHNSQPCFNCVQSDVWGPLIVFRTSRGLHGYLHFPVSAATEPIARVIGPGQPPPHICCCLWQWLHIWALHFYWGYTLSSGFPSGTPGLTDDAKPQFFSMTSSYIQYQHHLGDWRDGLVVKTSWYSCRWLGIDSQYPHGSLKPFLIYISREFDVTFWSLTCKMKLINLIKLT